jgi:hypothetical protein
MIRASQARIFGGANSELVAEYETEHGPLPAASRQRARQFLIEVGLLDDEPQLAAG